MLRCKGCGWQEATSDGYCLECAAPETDEDTIGFDAADVEWTTADPTLWFYVGRRCWQGAKRFYFCRHCWRDERRAGASLRVAWTVARGHW